MPPIGKQMIPDRGECQSGALACFLDKISIPGGDKPCRIGVSDGNGKNRVFRHAYRLYARFFRR